MCWAKNKRTLIENNLKRRIFIFFRNLWNSPVSLRRSPSFLSLCCFPPRHLVVPHLGPVVAAHQVDVVVVLGLALPLLLQPLLSEVSPEYWRVHAGHLVVPHWESDFQVLGKGLWELWVELQHLMDRQPWEALWGGDSPLGGHLALSYEDHSKSRHEHCRKISRLYRRYKDSHQIRHPCLELK